ncbi:sodium-dependent transporter [Fidelibacter multiformis]|uniref:sodium-dependent transporter n=1 Tax=Fidelibacter multiformis TaxID=3377529 RepID=UPI0037DC865A
MAETREHWGSHIGFILAAAGSAIGLGNIWKFPYVAGKNGGAAFILIYLISVFFIGISLVIAEILIGRKSQLNPVGAYRKLLKGHRGWTLVGYLGVFTGFIILSYYNVVAGWSVGYFIEGVRGSVLSFTSSEEAADFFNHQIMNPAWIIGYQAIFSILVLAVVYFGVAGGIERISRILMPVFLGILLILVGWGISLEGSREGLSFLLKPNWESVNGRTVLEALGQAFFSLSLGMGALLTYGSYLNKDDSILSSSIMIAFLDTLIALLAGVAIFTSVFAMGFSPDTGPGLVFCVLPAVFSKMPGGYAFGLLFFLLLTIAALTSAISLLEVITSYFVDEKKWTRHRVVLGAGLIVFLVGIPSALSFGPMRHVTVFKRTFFDFLDFLSSNILLPLGGLLMALFVGWYVKKTSILEEFRKGAGGWVDTHVLHPVKQIRHKTAFLTIGNVWFFVVKYLAPVVILLVFLYSIGILS